MIRPLDLQTLYMNLDKVGKEQAQSKEAQAQAQANQVNRLAREHDQEQHAVVRTPETGGAASDDAVKVRADDRRRQGRSGKQSDDPGKDEPAAEENAESDSWSDPELGKHIDLSG